MAQHNPGSIAYLVAVLAATVIGISIYFLFIAH
jgi:hypothetical protein